MESIPNIPDLERCVEKILRLLKSHGGKTPEEDADKLDMEFKNVKRILEALFEADIVERKQEKIGGGKIYNIVKEVLKWARSVKKNPTKQGKRR